jgi:hypothetical protein
VKVGKNESAHSYFKYYSGIGDCRAAYILRFVIANEMLFMFVTLHLEILQVIYHFWGISCHTAYVDTLPLVSGEHTWHEQEYLFI